MIIENWNSVAVEAARSRGGVLALARVRDNLITTGIDVWPPPEILQKLYQSRQARAFDPDELAILTTDLGYYCDLQSVHSEDAITWSYLAPVATSEASVQVGLLNWLSGRMGLPATNSACAISILRRIPHPDTLVSGGPELDVLLIGDQVVLMAEAKWRSGEVRGQGISGRKSQLQLRAEYFTKYGHQVFGDRAFGVLGLVLRHGDLAWDGPDDGTVTFGSVTWEELVDFEPHPYRDEYGRYYRWKLEHSKK
jgi:hypothetical protein